VKTGVACAVLAACAVALPAASAETYPNIEIYSVTARGRVANLSSSPALDTAPSPSPDGKRIAFVSSRDGQPDIYVMSSAGGAATRLTTSPFDDEIVAWNDAGTTSIAWSPDSKRLAFDVQNATFEPTCMKNCVSWSVYLINADGTGLHSIATEARAPAWSRDGRRLAYEDLITPFGEALGVAIDRINGTRVRFRTFNADSSVGPTWSPRRDELAFQANNAVYTVRADGTGRHRLALGATPSWSPDGAALAFTHNGVLLRVPRAGGTPRRLARGPRLGSPAWSPGGHSIAVVVAGHPQKIGVVPATGGPQRGLVAAPGYEGGLAWLGRTGSLLFTRCSSGCPS